MAGCVYASEEIELAVARLGDEWGGGCMHVFDVVVSCKNNLNLSRTKLHVILYRRYITCMCVVVKRDYI